MCFVVDIRLLPDFAANRQFIAPEKKKTHTHTQTKTRRQQQRRMRRDVRKFKWSPTRLENHFESKQISFLC